MREKIWKKVTYPGVRKDYYLISEDGQVMNIVTGMLRKLRRPYFTSVDVPDEIADDLSVFKDLCMEYVYYRYMFIDRIDRCD